MRKGSVVLLADPNDPEDVTVTVEGLERAQKTRFIRMMQTALSLWQPEFATRFHVPVGTLRDRGRCASPRPTLQWPT